MKDDVAKPPHYVKYNFITETQRPPSALCKVANAKIASPSGYIHLKTDLIALVCKHVRDTDRIASEILVFRHQITNSSIQSNNFHLHLHNVFHEYTRRIIYDQFGVEGI